MTNRTSASWLVYVLGALCIGAVVTAVLTVGPTSQSAAVQRRVVTVAKGVVQSTVSGSGSIQAATQLDLGFKTSGVVQHIYVSAGAHVTEGQLIAELDPQSAEVALEAARAKLQSAEASLVQEEEDEGETSGAQGSGEVTAGAAGVTSTTTTPTISTPASAPTTTTTSPSTTTKTQSSAKTKSQTSTETKSTSEEPKQSAVTREANLASARAAVRSARLNVESDQQEAQDTKLYAPDSGTIVSLGGEVGESVSGGGTSKASSTSEASSSGGSGTGGAKDEAAASSSSSSSTVFAVLTNLSAMQLVVPLSESEIVHVRAGQPATVTVEALEGTKLAAEVTAVATLPSSSSGVVDYDVTFKLDQLTAGLKPGMSASAEVVVKQAEGVNVPSRAISGGMVTVVHGGSETRRSVVTGLAGDSTTIITSGLKAGEQIALPLSSTSSSSSSALSRLAGRSGATLGIGIGAGGFGRAGAGAGGPPAGGGG